MQHWPICLPFGLVPLGVGVWQRIQESSPRHWPEVAGTVVATKIDRSYVGNGGYQFVPVIEYEYQYDGQTFRSSRRCAGNFVSGVKGEAEFIALRYPLGASLRVRVSPKNPAKSALEYGNTTLSWILIVIGLIFTTLAILFPLYL